MQDYEETPKYKKKSRRRTTRKANHKHNFQPCVFEYDGIELDKAHGFVKKPDVMGGWYCPTCGKIGMADNFKWYEDRLGWALLHTGHHTEEAKRELSPETRTLPTFYLKEGWSQKYVEL